MYIIYQDRSDGKRSYFGSFGLCPVEPLFFYDQKLAMKFEFYGDCFEELRKVRDFCEDYCNINMKLVRE